MTSKYLVEHANREVWCAPDQDSQMTFEPFPLSPTRGSRRDQKVEWQVIPMPNQDDAFYVYQIGNVHPGLLGLFPKVGRWITAAEQCNIQGMVIDIFTINGIQLPRFEVWLAVMYDRNLVMCIKSQGEQLDLEAEKIFIRFYSNAFFSTSRSDYIPEVPGAPPPPAWYEGVDSDRAVSPGDVIVEGQRLTDRQQLLLLQRRLTELNASGIGRAYAFYNGRFVTDFSAAWFTNVRFVKNDWAEIVYDASIIEVVDFPIAGLKSYDSILDKVKKYLLHRTEWVDYIQYRDDNDLFITAPLNAFRFEGVYYHRNRDISVRMVTHQDYGIPVPFVLGYRNATPAMTDMSACSVRLHVRASGFKRPLVNEHQRIKELYKLHEPDRLNAMVGLQSSLACWRADNMENELYPSFMRSRTGEFALSDVEQAYGYNAISKLVADSPLTPVPSGQELTVTLPRGLWNRATIFEYNSSGHLLGWYPAMGSRTWFCVNPNCAFIEGRVGIGSTYLDTDYAARQTVLNPNYDYAFFKVPYQGGKPGKNWQVAVKGTDYVIIDGVCHWNLDPAGWYTAVRSNSHFLTYAIDVVDSDGLLVFSLQSQEDDPAAPANRVTEILPGKIDLIMNGRALIKGLDYFRKGPQFVITNKEFRRADGKQRIVIRGTGLPRLVDGEWVEESPVDQGFIAYGMISHNRRYDLRDDKVQRIVVRGSVRLPSDLKYPETGLGVLAANVINGDPYAVEEVIVPVKEFTEEGTYILRDRSLIRDGEVSDYMTRYLPEPEEPNANPIPERYEIYSPFAAKIMHDLVDGKLVIGEAIKDFSYPNSKLKEWLKDYLYLLDYEPTKMNLDDRYVSVHPHELYTVVEMNVYHHHLLKRAVKVFLDDRVNLSRFVSIADDFVPIIP